MPTWKELLALLVALRPTHHEQIDEFALRAAAGLVAPVLSCLLVLNLAPDVHGVLRAVFEKRQALVVFDLIQHDRPPLVELWRRHEEVHPQPRGLQLPCHLLGLRHDQAQMRTNAVAQRLHVLLVHDCGSRPPPHRILKALADLVDLPVKIVAHEHSGLARPRNCFAERAPGTPLGRHSHGVVSRAFPRRPVEDDVRAPPHDLHPELDRRRQPHLAEVQCIDLGLPVADEFLRMVKVHGGILGLQDGARAHHLLGAHVGRLHRACLAAADLIEAWCLGGSQQRRLQLIGGDGVAPGEGLEARAVGQVRRLDDERQSAELRCQRVQRLLGQLVALLVDEQVWHLLDSGDPSDRIVHEGLVLHGAEIRLPCRREVPDGVEEAVRVPVVVPVREDLPPWDVRHLEIHVRTKRLRQLRPLGDVLLGQRRPLGLPALGPGVLADGDAPGADGKACRHDGRADGNLDRHRHERRARAARVARGRPPRGGWARAAQAGGGQA
mmetsp:Transcript_77852/g.238211  ORF Transcript_77852/g.238211 Transcript_77852/m.238211 type:complete len:495 (-) Transcript_77852:15-1499(-)